MIPSVPHTGSASMLAGGHDRGQFDETALLSLLLVLITAGWVSGNQAITNYVKHFDCDRRD